MTECPGCIADRVGADLSTVDTEMRHGRKSSSQRFDGYKIHAAVTNSEVPLITAVEVTAASDQDGPQAPGLVDQQPEHRRPQRLLGDTAYGTGPVRSELAERNIDVLAPVPEAPVEGRLGKRDFQIDPDGHGHLPSWPQRSDRTGPSGNRRALWPRSRAASARSITLPGATHQPQKLEILPEERLIAARATLAIQSRRLSPDTASSALLGLLAYRYHARQTLIGSAKAATGSLTPPWSTSTRSATNWPPKPPEQAIPATGPAVHLFNAHNATPAPIPPTIPSTTTAQAD